MDSLDGPDELRQGTPKNYITIWKKGDAVPAASEEMEKYIELEDTCCSSVSYPPDEDADEGLADSIWITLDRLRETVPEWK